MLQVSVLILPAGAIWTIILPGVLPSGGYCCGAAASLPSDATAASRKRAGLLLLGHEQLQLGMG